MENGEIKISEEEAVDHTGYSEKKVNKALELQAGQWLDLNNKKSSPQKGNKPLSRPVQIPQQSKSNPKKSTTNLVGAIDKVTKDVAQLIDTYLKTLDKNTDDAEKVLKDLTAAQNLQKILLKAMLFEAKGSLDITKLPKEAQNLLK